MFSGKSNSVGSRHLSFFFTLRIWRQSFLLTNLTPVLSFSFKRWQTWTSRSSISTPIFLKIPPTVPNRIWNANNLHSVSPGILDVFPALFFCFHNSLYKSVANSPNDSNICFQLFTMNKSVFNFLRQIRNLWTQSSFSLQHSFCMSTTHCHSHVTISN